MTVSIRNLTKKYKLQKEKYSTLRELFLSGLLFWQRRQTEELVALNNISFDVPKGQTLGIIGENGSGKSSLLRLILGITPPTDGEIQIEGKIAALLELGSGFHPDLTGRENIYLNGSVLGIPKKILKLKIDEIIDFAELHRFIDTPIKHYSSGMYVRLGFSIAVHTDPDILLVDEVLAVGDAAFQQKCLEIVRNFQQQGKTIIIVSHDLGMLEKICHRVILLNRGNLEMDGAARPTVRYYYQRIMQQRMQLAKQYPEVQVIPTKKIGYRICSGEIKITSVRILNHLGEESYLFQPGDALTIEAEFESNQRIDNPIFGLGWMDEEGHYLNGSNTKILNMKFDNIQGKGKWRVQYTHMTFQPGKYLLSLGIYRDPITDDTAYDYHACLYSIFVSSGNTIDEGFSYIPQQWTIEQI